MSENTPSDPTAVNLGERKIFRTSPLYRLQSSLDRDLDQASQLDLEEKLIEKFGHRLEDAEIRRDNNFKGLIIFDAILAIIVSGQDFKLPFADISTTQIPALLEILIGLCSISICTTATTFTSWLCYSQLLYTLKQREARRKNMDGGILPSADHYEEIALKLFNIRVTLHQDEMFEPGIGFRCISFIFSTATKIIFASFPIIHFMLLYFATLEIYNQNGFSILHYALYAAVISSHTLAIIVWFVPNMTFTFFYRDSNFRTSR